MTAWSKSEAERTIEEVKRRSSIDPEFRTLALTDPISALARINPRPVPVGLIRFVESIANPQEIDHSGAVVVILPDPSVATDELSDDDLEDVAGGGSGPPPVGLS